jgi:hypothetical protein
VQEEETIKIPTETPINGGPQDYLELATTLTPGKQTT